LSAGVTLISWTVCLTWHGAWVWSPTVPTLLARHTPGPNAVAADGNRLPPRKDRCPRLIMGPEGVVGQEFALQGGEEPFGQRMVVTAPDGPHSGADPGCRTPFTKRPRRIVAAVIQLVHDPRCWSPVPEGHLQRCQAQLGGRMCLYRQRTTHRLQASRI